MNYSNFEAKVSFWPHMHFTAIEIEQRAELFEIYATDITRLSKSKLFLGRTQDEKLAESYKRQFEEWLPKVHRSLKLRAIEPLTPKNTPSSFVSKNELDYLPGQAEVNRNRSQW